MLPFAETPHKCLPNTSILWFTWFLAGMFDVRFVTDGLLERVIRSMHLGVMIGFSVVVTAFDPDNQKQTTFQTLCEYMRRAAHAKNMELIVRKR